MGAAISTNVASNMASVSNNISHSTSISDIQKGVINNQIGLDRCTIYGNTTINNTSTTVATNTQVAKITNDDSVNNTIAQQLQQTAKSMMGSLGIGIADASNYGYNTTSATTSINTMVKQLSSQSAYTDDGFWCQDSTIYGNLTVNDTTNDSFTSNQQLQEKNRVQVTNDITQAIKQKASATVQGLGAFLIAIAVCIAAAGYALSKMDPIHQSPTPQKDCYFFCSYKKSYKFNGTANTPKSSPRIDHTKFKIMMFTLVTVMYGILITWIYLVGFKPSVTAGSYGPTGICNGPLKNVKPNSMQNVSNGLIQYASPLQNPSGGEPSLVKISIINVAANLLQPALGAGADRGKIPNTEQISENMINQINHGFNAGTYIQLGTGGRGINIDSKIAKFTLPNCTNCSSSLFSLASSKSFPSPFRNNQNAFFYLHYDPLNIVGKYNWTTEKQQPIINSNTPKSPSDFLATINGPSTSLGYKIKNQTPTPMTRYYDRWQAVNKGTLPSPMQNLLWIPCVGDVFTAGNGTDLWNQLTTFDPTLPSIPNNLWTAIQYAHFVIPSDLQNIYIAKQEDVHGQPAPLLQMCSSSPKSGAQTGATYNCSTLGISNKMIDGTALSTSGIYITDPNSGTLYHNISLAAYLVYIYLASEAISQDYKESSGSVTGCGSPSSCAPAPQSAKSSKPSMVACYLTCTNPSPLPFNNDNFGRMNAGLSGLYIPNATNNTIQLSPTANKNLATLRYILALSVNDTAPLKPNPKLTSSAPAPTPFWAGNTPADVMHSVFVLNIIADLSGQEKGGLGTWMTNTYIYDGTGGGSVDEVIFNIPSDPNATFTGKTQPSGVLVKNGSVVSDPMFVSENIYKNGSYLKATGRFSVEATMPLYAKSSKKPEDFCIRYVPTGSDAATQIKTSPITGGVLVGSMGSSFDNQSKKKYIGTIVCTVISLIIYIVFLVLLFKGPSKHRSKNIPMRTLRK